MNEGSEKYYQYVRSELIEGIPFGEHRVLEVGCAEGATGMALKKSGCASEVIGIELVPEAAAVAEKKLDHVVCGDLEQLNLQEPWFKENSFDYILCGDVLEHLRDPWTQLIRLTKFLKSDGKIVISLPNVRHYSVLFPLLFCDDWKYRESGILDSTHLRFYTKKTSKLLIKSAGLLVVSVSPVINRRRDKYFNFILGRFFERFISSQWIIVAKL